MDRTIFHVDVNSAFLSWSALRQLRENPGSIDLRTIPSAVGGDVQTRHGVITAKSIPAKAYHVQTGEPVIRALEKCPQLVLVQSDFKTYRMYSRQFIDILKEYTDQIQQASIDEAYMDVSDLIRDRGEALRLAAAIKDSVRDRLGFTVNIGVSVNKFLAKMASDFEKPDKVHTLYPEEIRGKMWPMDVRDLYGCGAATAQQLHGLGLKTIGEVAVCDENLLKSILGEKRGEYLHRRANGIDLSPIEKVRQEAKSYSNETTTAADIDRNNYEADAIPIIRKLSLKVAERLRKDDVFGATCFVQVKTGGFQRHSRQTRMKQSSNDGNMIFETASLLMKDLTDALFDKGEVLRLIGVGVSGINHGEYQQMGMDAWLQENEKNQEKKEKQKKLDEMVKKIRMQYGEKAVMIGEEREARQ
jgi:DNA polymerase-4